MTNGSHAESGSTAAAIDALTTEVAQLKDLFLRRLMDDKAKKQLFEATQDQLRASQELLNQRALDGLVKEILLVIDRLAESADDTGLAESVVTELHEVLRRRGIEQVPADTAFNPAVHQVSKTATAVNPQQVGTIVDVHRHGYQVDDRLLRPSMVTLAVQAAESVDE